VLAVGISTRPSFVCVCAVGLLNVGAWLFFELCVCMSICVW
jgi:hypothetical protein